MRQRLANAHNLRKNKKKKSILHAEDEFEFLKTLYTSTETIYFHERYRVQLALIMQLVDITNNRSSTLLTICYQHIKMILLSNFDNKKQSRMLIEIVFQHIKDYLKKKDAYVSLFYVVFSLNFVCIAVVDDVIKMNLRFQMFWTSCVYCFVFTSRCLLYSF